MERKVGDKWEVVDGGVAPSVSLMFMCVVFERSGRWAKRANARVYFIVFFVDFLEDESMVV